VIGWNIPIPLTAQPSRGTRYFPLVSRNKTPGVSCMNCDWPPVNWSIRDWLSGTISKVMLEEVAGPVVPERRRRPSCSPVPDQHDAVVGTEALQLKGPVPTGAGPGSSYFAIAPGDAWTLRLAQLKRSAGGYGSVQLKVNV